MVLAATPNQHSSGLIRRCSTATIDNDIMALMLCPSALPAPTLLGYLNAYKSILRAPTTTRRVDVVLAATPNQHSSGLIRRCSTATIDIDIMALMLCPSALSVPTLMGHFLTRVLNFKVNQITYLHIYKTDQLGTYSTVFFIAIRGSKQQDKKCFEIRSGLDFEEVLDTLFFR